MSRALVGIVMGSQSDWKTMEQASLQLKEFHIEHEVEIVSAHRTPAKLFEYATQAESRGLKVLIAGAGGAAHLPGMLASMTPLPVLGVPMVKEPLNGLDSLLSIVQMPAGIPVATFALGVPGAKNAALFATSILALEDKKIASTLKGFRETQTKKILDNPKPESL